MISQQVSYTDLPAIKSSETAPLISQLMEEEILSQSRAQVAGVQELFPTAPNLRMQAQRLV